LNQLRERFNGPGCTLKLRNRRELMQQIDVGNLPVLEIERNFAV